MTVSLEPTTKEVLIAGTELSGVLREIAKAELAEFEAARDTASGLARIPYILGIKRTPEIDQTGFFNEGSLTLQFSNLPQAAIKGRLEELAAINLLERETQVWGDRCGDTFPVYGYHSTPQGEAVVQELKKENEDGEGAVPAPIGALAVPALIGALNDSNDDVLRYEAAVLRGV